ncbi:hypothetical protein B0H13DRAFT_1892985 [Mycena leptocephala]|nr:hypothetical protein B0H13DRAFT_1892985 [Mycena leptocephala]
MVISHKDESKSSAKLPRVETRSICAGLDRAQHGVSNTSRTSRDSHGIANGGPQVLLRAAHGLQIDSEANMVPAHSRRRRAIGERLQQAVVLVYCVSCVAHLSLATLIVVRIQGSPSIDVDPEIPPVPFLCIDGAKGALH